MTRIAPPNHVLVTQGFLMNIAGSETVTFEVAQHFSVSGARVTIVTNGIADIWSQRFLGLVNCTVVMANDPLLDGLLRADPPDLAWIHHQLVPEFILRNRESTTVVFNHMSGAHPLEYPFSTAVVRALASLVVFNAKEILDIQAATGILVGIPSNRHAVFGNPAPDAFYVETPRPRPALSKLLVVSNHIPEELFEAIALIRSWHEIEVDVIGLESHKGARVEPITPAIILGADAVITIGKTVQYSIASGVPVYLYDKFGGPGWLSSGTFFQAQEFNFSGRSFGNKSAGAIAEEIIEGFATATAESQELHALHARSLTLGGRMPALLAAAHDAGRPGGRLSELEIQAHLKMQQSLGTYIVVASDNEKARAQAQRASQAVHDHLRRVEATWTFRLARRITGVSSVVGRVLRALRLRR
jgi:hypothetical protein